MFTVARGGAVLSGEHLKKSVSWKYSLSEGFLIFIELIYALIRINVVLIESFVRLFIPLQEKCLEGEIALVTGSGHGIGQELVLRLASEGCKVVGWDKNDEGNAITRKLAKERGLDDRVHFYLCDVTKREDVLSLAGRVEEEVGHISLLVNNAGVMVCKPFTAQTHSDIQTVINVNLLSHFWMLEAFLPKMKERRRGHVVAIASACGMVGAPNAVPYSVSKFGLRGLMEALHEELRITDANCSIKLTTINPLAVDTGLAKRPKSRFPSVVKILTVNEVIEAILKSIKTEAREVSVPRHFYYFDQFMRLFPDGVYEIVKDFLDAGVDPE